MNRIIFTILLIMLSITVYVKPEENKTIDEKPVSLDEAVALALKNNLDYKSEALSFDQKKWEIATSWNEFVPTMSLGANLVRSNLDKDDRKQTTVVALSNGLASTHEYTSPLWSLGFSFGINYSLNASNFFNVYQTVLDYKSSKINFEKSKNDLTRNVKKSYFNMLLMLENISVIEKQIQVAKGRFETIQAKYNNGLTKKYDMISAQVSYENLKPSLLEMKNNYEIALFNFKNMLGIKQDIGIRLQGDFISEKKSYDYKAISEKYVDKSFDIQLLKNDLENFRNSSNKKIADLTPTFSFSYTADPTFQKDPMKDNWFGDQQYMKDNYKEVYGMGQFSFSISLPLNAFVPFSKENMKILLNSYDIEKAKIKINQKRMDVDENIKTYILKLEKSEEQIQSYKLNVELANEAYDLASEGYKEGTKTLLEVQDSEKELNSARLNLLQEEYNYTAFLLDLQYLTNNDLKELSAGNKF